MPMTHSATQPNAGSVASHLRPLQRIVVGVDFSDSSRRSLVAAGDLATLHGAAVTIVHGVDPMLAALEVAPQAIIDDIRAGLAAEQRVLTDRSVKAASQMRIGKAWWAVNETAAEINADLVVVASHGRGGLARAALGSTADRVVRTCIAPVLVIPDDHANSPVNWRVGVVGVDFSEESRSAIALAARILSKVNAPKATLVLFHTVALMVEFRGPVAPLAMPQQWDDAEAVARRTLEGITGSFKSERLDMQIAAYRGFAADGILHEARTRNADFIALGTHGRNTINRMLLGSVAERVLHHARRPVLTVRQAVP
jgi:nucleotide-binding universal stress UspA family protein